MSRCIKTSVRSRSRENVRATRSRDSDCVSTPEPGNTFLYPLGAFHLAANHFDIGVTLGRSGLIAGTLFPGKDRNSANKCAVPSMGTVAGGAFFKIWPLAFRVPTHRKDSASEERAERTAPDAGPGTPQLARVVEAASCSASMRSASSSSDGSSASSSSSSMTSKNPSRTTVRF